MHVDSQEWSYAEQSLRTKTSLWSMAFLQVPTTVASLQRIVVYFGWFNFDHKEKRTDLNNLTVNHNNVHIT